MLGDHWVLSNPVDNQHNEPETKGENFDFVCSRKCGKKITEQVLSKNNKK